MAGFWRDLGVQLKGVWSRLDGGQRLTVAAVLAATLVGLGAMVWFAGQPTWSEVFEASAPEDMRDARRQLTQAGVPFVTDDSGMRILVERELVPQANTVIFEAGLRSGSSSRSLDNALGLTHDRSTRAWILDAKTRARTEEDLSEIEGVVHATVNFSKPPRSAFRDRDAETRPRATVTLRLRPGVRFERVAKAAASMTSAAVGVPMENVDVVNASTHARWTWDADAEAGGGTSDFLALQRAYSESRTGAAQAALDAVYPGKTLVRVNVELDPKWEIVNTKVIPDEPLLRSEHTTKDTIEDGVGAPAGDPSTAASTLEEAQTDLNPPRSSSKKETKEREYVTDIGERRQGKLSPEVERITVALLYDRGLEGSEGFATERLGDVVKSIVGWDPERDGDGSFSVLAGEFPEAPPPPSTVEAGALESALEYAPVAGQVLGVVLVLLFLRGLLRRSRPRVTEVAPMPAASPEQTSAEERNRQMRREIEKAIATDPASISRMLETWLAEQKA